MKRDDKFEPKVGKIRQQKVGRSGRTLSRTARAINVAGGQKLLSGNRSTLEMRRNARSLIRGAGSGGGARVRTRMPGQRRVVIKARIVRIAGRGLGAMKAHLNYIERDGVTRDGSKGQMYGPEGDQGAAKDFAKTCAEDRHQFRFIVAPEDGARLEDLKPFVRDLMAQVEKDLDTKLDWVAVDHFNTGHPHSHIVIRGKTDKGDDLIIARDYISHGLRARAADLLTLELGPKSEIELVQGWRVEVTAERFTGLDQELLRKSQNSQVKVTTTPRNILERVRGDLLVQRLQQLETMQLATNTGAWGWQLSSQFEQTLRTLSERGDIIKTMQRALKDYGRERDPQRWQIASALPDKSIVGKVVSRGLSDEHRDQHYLIIDGIDGKVHYVDAGPGTLDKAIRRGAMVEIAPITAALESGDAGIINRKALHRQRTNQRVLLLSRWSLDEQAQADGATWLDKRLVNPRKHEDIATTGFGKGVRAALTQRQHWLVSQRLADEITTESGTTFQPKPRLLSTLRNRDLNRAAITLAAETGMDVEIARRGDTITGTLIKRLDLMSGRFAVVDQSQSRGFGLAIAPWSSTLDRARGQQISGVMLGSQMRWTIGKEIGMDIG